MAYEVACKECGTNLGRIAGTQDRGARLDTFRCKCGGELRRIGWQEMYRRSGRLKLAADVAAEYLRETGNTGVGYGDNALLHAIADRLGMPHEGPLTARKLLDRIDRSCRGVLEKRYGSFPECGLTRVRQYWLPESAPLPGPLHDN